MKRFLLSETKQNKADEEDVKLLIENILKANSRERLENLLFGLMTQKEIEEFAGRIRIVKLLKKDISQHDIANKLGVGVATVTRGAKEIKQGNFKYV